MCLSRCHWTCPHGFEFDSLRQSMALMPSAVFSTFASDGHALRYFHYCPQCVAEADALRARMLTWADAESDRCEV